MILHEKEILEMDKIRRLNLINSIPGYKSANLLGTASKDLRYNLAIFSSVIHLGSNPALLGFILRPLVPDRHTYQNIRETKYYTINHVHVSFIKEAHQTSAKYPEYVSEFDRVGLTPEKWENYPVPYVKESLVKIGMEYREEYLIRANNTRLIVGKILEMKMPDEILLPDGSLDLNQAGTVTISGLRSYHEPKKITDFDYARP